MAIWLTLVSGIRYLGSAVRVFESATEKDVVTSSSMITGYGVHGLGQQAVALYQRMVASSVRPNSQTFVSLLSACVHSGLVKEGKFIFKSMTQFMELHQIQSVVVPWLISLTVPVNFKRRRSSFMKWVGHLMLILSVPCLLPAEHTVSHR
jgi:pentatricopeptide repeat protein